VIPRIFRIPCRRGFHSACRVHSGRVFAACRLGLIGLGLQRTHPPPRRLNVHPARLRQFAETLLSLTRSFKTPSQFIPVPHQAADEVLEA
jgi:hypothetical protein